MPRGRQSSGPSKLCTWNQQTSRRFLEFRAKYSNNVFKKPHVSRQSWVISSARSTVIASAGYSACADQATMRPCPNHSSRSPSSRTRKALLNAKAWSSCSGRVSSSCNSAGRCHSSVLRFFFGGSPAAFAEAPTAVDGFNADFHNFKKIFDMHENFAGSVHIECMFVYIYIY